MRQRFDDAEAYGLHVRRYCSLLSDDKSGPGAISVETTVTYLVTTGADALTLADGLREDQLKIIRMVTDGGDGTLTPANLAGGTTLTFGDAGDLIVLQWRKGEWHVLFNSGVTLA